MANRQHKSFQPSSVKFDMDGSRGQFTAHFAKLGVIDRDGDVIVSGALGSDAPLDVIISSWGHKWQELPVGRGTVYEEGEYLVCSGKFFIDTEDGDQTYKTVKGLGDLCEWSFGFNVLAAEPGSMDNRPVQYLKRLSIFEVSPVLQGAGIETRTVDIKAAEPQSDDDADSKDDAAEELCEHCGEEDCMCKDEAAKSTLAALIEFEMTQAKLLGVNIT